MIRGPDFVAPPAVGPPIRAEEEVRWPPPPSEIVREDLLFNAPGEQLGEQIAAAHRAGERPTALRRLLLGKHAYSTWERGAIGEWLVAEQLAALAARDSRWGFLHSIPVGHRGADIDHLIIGPGGVFTLNAKHHDGCSIWVARNTFMVNGTYQPYVRNSRHEAQRAARLLKRASGMEIPVTGVVVPVNARSILIKEYPEDVLVVERMDLVPFLLGAPPVLMREQVERLFEHARLRSTWTTGAHR